MPVETPPSRPKKPCAMPGRSEDCGGECHARHQNHASKPRRLCGADGGRQRQRLEQRAHLVRRRSGVRPRLVTVARPRRDWPRVNCSARAPMPRSLQKFALAVAGRRPPRRHAVPLRPARRNRHGPTDRSSPGSASTSANAWPPTACKVSPKPALRHSHNRSSAPRRPVARSRGAISSASAVAAGAVS